MKKTLIACLIVSIFTAGLTGCGKSDKELKQEAAAQHWQDEQVAKAQQAQADLQSQQAAAAQQANDDQELRDIVTELKKGDPLVKDAYYGYNEKGDRVLHVVRDNPPQTQPQAGYGQPQYQNASGQPVIINNQPAQQASSGVSEAIWPLAAGVGAGMLLAHAMNSGGGYNSYSSYHQPYSTHNYSDSDYRRERTSVVNNYHTTVVNNTRTTYKAQATPVQPTSKVAPGSSSYAQTKALSSPVVSKPDVQPTAKPLVNAPVNSYWSQPKSEPAKTASASSYSRPSSSSSSFGSSSSRSSSSFSSSRSSSRR